MGNTNLETANEHDKGGHSKPLRKKVRKKGIQPLNEETTIYYYSL